MTLLDDPVKWSASAVATWPRFALYSSLLLCVVGGTVYVAASEGLGSGLAAATFLGALQLIHLYALRQLFLRVSGQRGSNAV